MHSSRACYSPLLAFKPFPRAARGAPTGPRVLHVPERLRQVLATHKLPPPDMPGVAWMAHSFFNSSTGAVWPLNVTTPLPDSVARLARHAYFASVSWLDHQIGRILDELDELDIASQTIVVLRKPYMKKKRKKRGEEKTTAKHTKNPTPEHAPT